MGRRVPAWSVSASNSPMKTSGRLFNTSGPSDVITACAGVVQWATGGCANHVGMIAWIAPGRAPLPRPRRRTRSEGAPTHRLLHRASPSSLPHADQHHKETSNSPVMSGVRPRCPRQPLPLMRFATVQRPCGSGIPQSNGLTGPSPRQARKILAKVATCFRFWPRCLARPLLSSGSGNDSACRCPNHI